METDVAIIGAGGAGVCAAVEAAECGSRVAVFEKANAGGNTTCFAGAIFAVGSKMQQQEGVKLTKEEAFNGFMEFSHWRADARLVKAYVDQSASTIDWLKEHGVKFVGLVTYMPQSHRTMHITKPGSASHGGLFLVRQLVEWGKSKGVQYHFGARVTSIVKSSRGIEGIVATDKAGRTIEVKARAVIVASGGYAYNAELLKSHDGFDLERNLFMLHNFRQIRGDGLQMAWEAGAARDGMGPHLAGVELVGPGVRKGGEHGAPWLYKNQLPGITGQPYLWVNQNGSRFANEELIQDGPFSANALARQPEKCAYLLFDGNSARHLQDEGMDLVRPLFPKAAIIDLDRQIEQCLLEGNKNVFRTTTLEEMSITTGIDWHSLRQTLEAYNACCDGGKDTLFGKDAKYLHPVRNASFYAFRLYPVAYGTIGGIRINKNTEVVGVDGQVIPGLYAAGNDACGIYGDRPTYNHALGGGALGFAVNSGRIAGQNASEYVRGKDLQYHRFTTQVQLS